MPDFSFTDELYRPIFGTLGVPATLTLKSGTEISTLPDGTPLVLLDKTQGIDLSGGSATLETLKPVAEIMAADMLALGITRKDFEDGMVNLNNKLWNIIATKSNQSSFGPNDGTVFLILEGDSDD